MRLALFCLAFGVVGTICLILMRWACDWRRR